MLPKYEIHFIVVKPKAGGVQLLGQLELVVTLATYETIMQSLPLSPKTLANWSLVNCGVALRTSATCLPTLEFPTTTELSPPFSSARILHSSSNFSIFSTVFFKPSVAWSFRLRFRRTQRVKPDAFRELEIGQARNFLKTRGRHAHVLVV